MKQASVRRIFAPLVVGVAVAMLTGSFSSGQSSESRSPAILAEPKFQQLPGYSNYQTIKRSARKLAGGGSVFKLRWSADGNSVLYQTGGKKLQFDFADRQVRPDAGMPAWQPPPAEDRRLAPVQRAQQRTVERSPDGRWLARYVDNNIVLKSATDASQAEIAVTSGGTDRHRFGTCCWVYGEELDQQQAMWWSTDSRWLVYYEVDETRMRDYYLTTDNADRYTSIEATRYPKAGDANPRVHLWAYELATGQRKRLNIDGPEDQYLYSIRFAPHQPKPRLIVYRTNRRQDRLDVLLVDVVSGEVSTVVSERQSTWQENLPELRFLDDGQRFVWETERTGWKQYELRRLDGTRLNQLSNLNGLPVNSIEKIDERANWFYYTAFSAQNPYSLQLHRCRLDGSAPVRLTGSPLNHSDFDISPDHHWVVAKRQQIDVPVSTVVYDQFGNEAGVLAKGSTLPAQRAGLSPPEMFSFLADDGRTRIYGTLHKPAHAGNGKFPVLVDVYGGPQSTGLENEYQPANPICELGFIVVKVANRGTIGRGKAFESANFLKLGVTDLDDQAAAIRYLSSRPDVDAERVGIFGHSYGGYLAALALLRYPDTFDVAVAGAPVTDWRNYDTIYTERYLGLPSQNPSAYRNGSCVELANRLQGKLLLVHGLVDNNVHPANTWQLADALHAADKRFEMMIYPGFRHGIDSTYESLRWEFLCRHLKPDPVR